jgi:hypothetical protein
LSVQPLQRLLCSIPHIRCVPHKHVEPHCCSQHLCLRFCWYSLLSHNPIFVLLVSCG